MKYDLLFLHVTTGKLRAIRCEGKYGWLSFFLLLLLLLLSLGWRLWKASCAWHLIHHKAGEKCEMTGPSDVKRRGADGDRPNMVQQTEIYKSMAQESFCMHSLALHWLISMYSGCVATETINCAGCMLIGRHPKGGCGYCTLWKESIESISANQLIMSSCAVNSERHLEGGNRSQRKWPGQGITAKVHVCLLF